MAKDDDEDLPDKDAAKGFYAKYEPKEILGRGISSTVRRCIEKETGKEFAAKIIDLGADGGEGSSQQMLEATRQEIAILRQVMGHPFIIELQDVFESDAFIFLVFELCRNGELFDYLTSVVTLSEKKTRYIMRQVFEGVEYIHSHSIVHRDLKPENILLDNSFNVKITDFGFAKVLSNDQKLYDLCGTPGYLAPETLKCSMWEKAPGYSKEVDIWASGVIMFTLLVGCPPFWHRKQMVMLRNIMEGKYSFTSPEWADISEDPKDLIRKCLVVEPENRITVKEALKHPFFTTTIIEWVNKCSDGSANTQQKCEAIIQIQEVLLHSDSDLLDEFIDNILSFSHDPSQEVRRSVVGFIEEISKLHIDFIPRTINVLAGLLRDTSPQVIKRVIQACAAVYKNTLLWLVTLADISDDTESSWNTLCHMKAEIVDMIDHDNDGIRTNAIKFLEGVVILQTHHEEDSMKRENDFSLDDIPLTLKIARRRKLEDEARNIFENLLKFHAASHISSVNLIACTGSLCTIAKMRPVLMNVVVEALKSLLANLPPTLTDSQVGSVRKHLKMQLLNILKQPAAYEMQQTIIAMLIDLGASNQEISKALPKMNKQEQQKRAKRALENATAAAAKRIKLEKEKVPVKRQMEIDYDEVEEQKLRSNKLNETFIVEALQQQRDETIVDLTIATMRHLPNEMPEHFVRTYKPIMGLTTTQIVQKIAEGLAVLMTEKRIGPGASAITRDPPMKVKVSLEEEKNIILGMRKDTFELDEEMLDLTNEKSIEDIDARREEATKKLRENMERLKGEQAIIPMMKQKAKSLKLQEITKPMSRAVKEKFLLDAVMRILRAERASIVGGASVKRRKILTVMAATFTGSVRETIINFIMKDLKARIDLAFSWLFEEYSLFQGFTRHSYIKTEQKPDFAYNRLLNELIVGVTECTDIEVNKELSLRKIFLEAPILSDESIDQLVGMCELTEFSDCAMKLVKDLAVHRPPKKQKFLQILLRYSVHENITIREKAIENILSLYAEHKVLMNKIEDHALMWLSYLEKTSPPHCGPVFF